LRKQIDEITNNRRDQKQEMIFQISYLFLVSYTFNQHLNLITTCFDKWFLTFQANFFTNPNTVFPIGVYLYCKKALKFKGFSRSSAGTRMTRFFLSVFIRFLSVFFCVSKKSSDPRQAGISRG